jgi:CRP-like cAMP-binding protein
VLKRFGEEQRVVGTLGPGEYFGEMALLGRDPRSATARALTTLDVLVLPASDFSALAGSLPEFRRGFEEIALRRTDANAGSSAGDPPD